jgi:hypothetical protein
VGKIVDAYERYDAYERQSQLGSANRASGPGRRKGS